MVRFSIRERSDTLEIYLLKQKSPTAARREYGRLYPERRVPSKQIFARLAKKMQEKGTVLDVRSIRRRHRVVDEQNEVNILGFFETYPSASITKCYQELPVSRSSVHRVLKKYQYKPYKFRKTQKLSNEHCQRRLLFCEEFLNRYYQNPDYLKYICWTDESSFTTKRGCNSQNNRYWSTNNPHMIHEIKCQGYRSVNVWCGVIDRLILGPLFIDQKLTGERYFHLLQNEISGQIDDLPLNISTRMMWQQSAPPHNVIRV